MTKKYTLNINNRARRPRSERLRKLGGGGAAGGGSTVVNVTSSVGSGVAGGHTHANKSTLDKISIGKEDYLYVEQLRETEDGSGYRSSREKVKAGYADEAAHAIEADNADMWDSRQFDDYLDQPLRKTDSVEHKVMITDMVRGSGQFVDGLQGEGYQMWSDEEGRVRLTLDQLIARQRMVVPSADIDSLQTTSIKGDNFSLSESDGMSTLEVDKLLVRLKAVFTELQVHSIKHSGGSYIFSPAGVTVSKVEIRNASDTLQVLKGDDADGYGYVDATDNEYETLSTIDDSSDLVIRCYFTNKNGEEIVKNEFEVGDFVRYQSFNLVERTSSESYSNSYGWRKCVSKGYDYIDLYYAGEDVEGDESPGDEELYAAGSTIPKVGDVLVTFGSTDERRQSAIYMNAYGGTEEGMEEAPCIVQYKGIKSCHQDDLKQCIVTKISPDGNVFTGDFVIQNGDNAGQSLLKFTTDKFDVSIKEAKEAKTAANEAKLLLTPDNIAIQLTQTNITHNLFVDGSFEKGIVDIIGKGSIVIPNGGAFHGYNSFYCTTPGWDFTIGYGKVNKNRVYTIVFATKCVGLTESTQFGGFTIEWSDTSTFERIQTITLPTTTLTSEWSQQKQRFTTANLDNGYIRLKCSGYGLGSGLYIDAIMLLEGDFTTANTLPKYAESVEEDLRKDLLNTGIDIEHQKITLTADQFEVKNNDGETTATINEDGVLEMNSGVFKGRLSLPFRQLLVDGSDGVVAKNEANGFETIAVMNKYAAIYRIKDLNKGANICIIGDVNQYGKDGIELPVQPEYNGTLVTIIKKNKNKTFLINTNAESDELKLNYENIYHGFGGDIDGYYGFISHGTYGKSILMESRLDYEVLELMAVKIVPDITITDEGDPNYGKTLKGVCAWMILNPEKFNYTEESWEANGKYYTSRGYVSKLPEELLENRIKALENKLAN